jgi:restriction system protein
VVDVTGQPVSCTEHQGSLIAALFYLPYFVCSTTQVMVIMRDSERALTMTPRDYELLIKGILDAAGHELVEYRSEHLASLDGTDGQYVIDVVASFTALGAEFLVLVECKHHTRKVERQDVQVLHSKLQSLAAHKGMLFSVSGFQSGAVEYAAAHGIALVEVATGMSNWHTRGDGHSTPPPSWVPVPKFIGWLRAGNSRSLLSESNGENICKFFGFGEGKADPAVR